MKIKRLRDIGATVKASWVKSHAGTVGNELADELAKEAANEVVDTQPDKLPQSWIKARCKVEAIKEWQEEWDLDLTGRKTHDFISKVSEDRLIGHPAMTAYLTEHGPFPSYLNRFGLANSANCVCGDIGDPEHYMHYCRLTQQYHLRKPANNSKTHWADSTAKSPSLNSKLNQLYHWLLNQTEQVV